MPAINWNLTRDDGRTSSISSINYFQHSPVHSRGVASVGIDLGLNDFATMSDGTKIEAKRLYRDAETKLAVAQRANKKSRVKALHAQIARGAALCCPLCRSIPRCRTTPAILDFRHHMTTNRDLKWNLGAGDIYARFA